MVQHERDQKERIEKMVEQLARQHSHLEEAAQHALPDSLIEPQMSSNILQLLNIKIYYYFTFPFFKSKIEKNNTEKKLFHSNYILNKIFSFLKIENF